MNQRKGDLPQTTAANPSSKAAGGRQPGFSGGARQKTATAALQMKKQPFAPPVYRPEAKRILQPKMDAASPSPKSPQAPPAYRPQSTPKVLQAKGSPAQSTHAGQAPRRPVAPPVYRPEQKRVAQAKMAPAATPTYMPPQAPPVYRPLAKQVNAPSGQPAQMKSKAVAPAASHPPPARQTVQAKAAARPSRPSPHAQMCGVIQRDLAADLKTKKINVAVVGETHYEIDADEEVSTWEKEGIKVFYEADSVPLSGKSGEVTPDPLILRLTFGWTALTEHVGDYLNKVATSGKVVDTSDFPGVNWVLKYLLPVLHTDLARAKSEKPELDTALELLKELRPLLTGSKSKSLASSDELKRKVLARKLRRNMNEVGVIINDLHSKSEYSKVAYKSEDLKVERSRQMLLNVNQSSGSMEKTIYKVGNNHVLDMRREGWKVEPAVRVYNKTEYGLEYQSLKQKSSVSKPGVNLVSSSSSSPVPKSSSSNPVLKPSSSSSGTVPKLPEGWMQHKQSDGRIYYYIPGKSDSSTWTFPTSPAPRLLPTPSLNPTPLSTPKSIGLQTPSVSKPNKVTPTSSSTQKPSLVSTPLSSKTTTLTSAPIIKPIIPTSTETITNKPPTLKSTPTITNKPSTQPTKKKVLSIAVERPAWIPDDRRSNCSDCNTEFGLITRRHHCRACGEVFCSKCCNRKKEVPLEEQAVEFGKSPVHGAVLVCNDCSRNL